MRRDHHAETALPDLRSIEEEESVIRSDRFLISQRPYAVDLNGLDLSNPSRPTVRAAWFRRRKGVTVACLGDLWDIQRPLPTTAQEFLERHDDGRYGGDCLARWDGDTYWGAGEPDQITADLELLRPMLDNYPAIPAGFDGWWRFPSTHELQQAVTQ